MSNFYPFKDWLTAEPKNLITVNPIRTREQLASDVNKVVRYLGVEKDKRILISTDSFYSFLCLFIGTLLSGNRPVLFPKKTINAREVQLVDLSLTDQSFQKISKEEQSSNASFCENGFFFELFTSGSNGKPKKILKSVQQMDLEAVQTMALFSENAPKAIARTVDLEHQYGLTFSVWLPMTLGIPTYDRRISVPEECSKITHNSLLVSTPSFLANLDKNLPTPTSAMVISAGAPLPSKAASLVWEWLKTNVLEIYGSSEAGVIGFRKSKSGEICSFWQLFPDLIVKDGFLFSTGRTPDGLEIEDVLDFKDHRHFLLKGRKDRICKIGEERINLDRIENIVKETCSREVKILPIEKNGRLFLGAVLLMPEQTMSSRLDGPTVLRIREKLREKIPLLSLPRFWRTVPVWPRNNQGKIQNSVLQELFNE